MEKKLEEIKKRASEFRDRIKQETDKTRRSTLQTQYKTLVKTQTTYASKIQTVKQDERQSQIKEKDALKKSETFRRRGIEFKRNQELII